MAKKKLSEKEVIDNIARFQKFMINLGQWKEENGQIIILTDNYIPSDELKRRYSDYCKKYP